MFLSFIFHHIAWVRVSKVEIHPFISWATESKGGACLYLLLAKNHGFMLGSGDPNSVTQATNSLLNWILSIPMQNQV